MGHRHNRRRFRWRYKDNTKKWSATGCRLDAEEGVTLAHSLHSYQDLLGSHELPHDSEAGSRSTLDGSGHLGTLAELEEAQRRMFGGEVGDEELVVLGILSDKQEEAEPRPSAAAPASKEVLPRFRSRSRSRSGEAATSTSNIHPAPDDNILDGDGDWELMSSATWESGSEAWELLGDDS